MIWSKEKPKSQTAVPMLERNMLDIQEIGVDTQQQITDLQELVIGLIEGGMANGNEGEENL